MFSVRAILVALVQLRIKLVVAPLMIFTGRSWRGRVEGFSALLCAVILTAGLIYLCTLAFGTETSSVAGAVALGGLAVFFPYCILLSQMARKCHFGEGPVGSHFLKVEPSPDSLGWADVEDHYVWLSALLLTRLDPRLPAAEACDARDRVRELIDEVLAHPEYHCLARVGDTLGWGWFRGVLDPHHCYSYRPEPREEGERFGLLVILHEENYLFLLHALRPLCDRERLILIAPSFGYGSWKATGGVEAVERATRFGMMAFDADPARVVLAGVAEGGAGVSRAAAKHPDRFAGLVYISAAPEPGVTGAPEFVEAWKGRPVLVIHGDRDQKVPLANVTAACERLESDGVKVTLHREPEAGHYLFFAKLDEVNIAIAKWMEKSLHAARV